MPSVKLSPKQADQQRMRGHAAARSLSPAPSARAIADDTPPPMAPPDMVMVRITNGNTSAIAASHSVPSRPI